jgi:hypothetical protein
MISMDLWTSKELIFRAGGDHLSGHLSGRWRSSAYHLSGPSQAGGGHLPGRWRSSVRSSAGPKELTCRSSTREPGRAGGAHLQIICRASGGHLQVIYRAGGGHLQVICWAGDD